MSESDYAVLLEDVRKDFMAKGKPEVHALQGVTLSIPRNSQVAIRGPSGSGKTTLLQIIGALEDPTSGRVVVDGRDLGTFGEAELTEYRARTIGFVFQNFNLIPNLSALENVELAMEALDTPRENRRTRAAELLGSVGMSRRADHRPGRLSAGEQQRVAIARALANRPSLVLADEPTGSLDSETGTEVTTLLLDEGRRNGATVIIVTHSDQVARRCDANFRIRDGRVTPEGGRGEDSTDGGP